MPSIVRTAANRFKSFALGLLLLGGCAPADEPPPAPQAIACYFAFFDYNSVAVTATADATLRQLASAVRGHRTVVAITAHTDRAGASAYNMALSQRRADALKARLVALGVPADAITTVGRGETQPLVRTADGVQEPQNRRADLVFN